MSLATQFSRFNDSANVSNSRIKANIFTPAITVGLLFGSARCRVDVRRNHNFILLIPDWWTLSTSDLHNEKEKCSCLAACYMPPRRRIFSIYLGTFSWDFFSFVHTLWLQPLWCRVKLLVSFLIHTKITLGTKNDSSIAVLSNNKKTHLWFFRAVSP